MVEKTHATGWLPNVTEPLRNIGQRVADWFAPLSEASAATEHYEISIELPGVKADDIDIAVHDNNLVVRGEKKSEHTEQGHTYFFSEREYGAFQRSFRLPPDANEDAIDAGFRDGVLTLKIAKRKPSDTTGRKIKIRQE